MVLKLKQTLRNNIKKVFCTFIVTSLLLTTNSLVFANGGNWEDVLACDVAVTAPDLPNLQLSAEYKEWLALSDPIIEDYRNEPTVEKLQNAIKVFKESKSKWSDDEAITKECDDLIKDCQVYIRILEKGFDSLSPAEKALYSGDSLSNPKAWELGFYNPIEDVREYWGEDSDIVTNAHVLRVGEDAWYLGTKGGERAMEEYLKDAPDPMDYKSAKEWAKENRLELYNPFIKEKNINSFAKQVEHNYNTALRFYERLTRINTSVPHDVELILGDLQYIINPDDKLKAYNTFEEKLLGGHFTSDGSYLSNGTRTTPPATVMNESTENYLNKRKLDIETSAQIWDAYKADNGYGYIYSGDSKGTWSAISSRSHYFSVGGYKEYYKHLSLAIEKCNELQKIADTRKASGLATIVSDRIGRFWDNQIKDYQNYIDTNEEGTLTDEIRQGYIDSATKRKFNQD